MIQLLYLFLIGISLSMDAFSLSLVYGLKKITKKEKILLSIIVAIYHFIMPLIGFFFSSLLIQIRIINISIISGIILIYVGINIIISKDEGLINNNIINYILFGLSVSIDSLTIGIGLRAITNNYILASIIFSLCSFSFTLIGLNIGSYLGRLLQKKSKIFGGIILILLGLIILISK